MMVWQLFYSPSQIKNCLLLGLGGGDMVRYWQHYFPALEILTVEQQPAINKIACEFFHLQPGETGLQCHIHDAEKFLVSNQQRHDLIFLDMLADDALPDFMHDKDFWLNCKKSLSENGSVIANIIVKDSDSLRELLLMIKSVFNYLPLCMNVPDHRNIILFLPPDSLLSTSVESLMLQAKPAEERYSLAFEQVVQQLCKDNFVENGYFKLR